MSDTPGAVLDAVRAQRDEMLAFLEQLVLHESPTSVPEAQAPIFDLIEEKLDEVGYETRRLPGDESGGQLLAAPRGRDFGGVDFNFDAAAPASDASPLVQLLIGHCDTVWPIGTLKEIPLQIDDSIMRGPGVFDMKAGLAQAVFALRTLQRLDLQPSLMPLLFINSDEEIGSPESTPHILRLARFASRVFVMEPALGRSGQAEDRPQGRRSVRRQGHRQGGARRP